jgi:4-hydroxy-tetrahydrodipicolinate reductase
MNIALVGYGKMGKEVEAQATARGHAIVHRIDDGSALKGADFSGVELAIEFTMPDQAVRSIECLATKGTSVVVGTTGWYKELPAVKKIVAQHKIGLLYSPNFSVGVHLFWDIVAHAAKLVGGFEQYDVYGHEWHHAKKADAPSGTALKTAELILKNFPRKKTLVSDTLHRAPKSDELQFTATRGGNVPGTHSVFFDSPADTIEITHTARNRSGFALGAVLAAEWLKGKTGIFTMEDCLKDLLH